MKGGWAGGAVPKRGATRTAARQPNLRDVAKLAGVAVSSASRALSGHPEVSAEMRAKVEAAAVQLGYEPDLLARSIRSGATLAIGFVVRDISSPLLAEVALGAETTLRKGGYNMLVLNSETDPDLDAGHIRLLERRRIDGLLISLVDEGNRDALTALRELSVPFVLIDREIEGNLAASSVLADYVGSTREIVSRLARFGHRRIGLAAGPSQVRPGRAVASAFRLACEENNVEAMVEMGPFAAAHGHEATARMLDSDPAPTAVVSGSNQIFPGVLAAIRERGLHFPRDLSLVTFGDLPLLELLETPVDVVRREPSRLGRQASDLLLQRLAGEPPQTVVAPTTFEPRGSSGPPPA